jgi:hypothetical protein
LTNKKIYRYAFNLALNYPEINLRGTHCHHINGVRYIQENLNAYAATDDRACNIDVISPDEHAFEHYIQMDRGYFDYIKESPADIEVVPARQESMVSKSNNPSTEETDESIAALLSFCQRGSIQPLHRSLFPALFHSLTEGLSESLEENLENLAGFE